MGGCSAVLHGQISAQHLLDDRTVEAQVYQLEPHGLLGIGEVSRGAFIRAFGALVVRQGDSRRDSIVVTEPATISISANPSASTPLETMSGSATTSAA